MSLVVTPKLKHKRKIVKNFLSLAALQGTNYILPLILFPYLVRVLGIELFGVLAFATATIAMMRGVVEYGFDLSGTRQIAMFYDNYRKRSEVFYSIIGAKFFNMIVMFFVLILLILLNEKINENSSLFFATFCIILGDVLFPAWYFQGIEKMNVIMNVKIITKTLFTLSVFAFVLNKDDMILIPIFDATMSFLGALFTFCYAHRNKDLKFVKLTKEDVFYQLKDGWHIFTSRFVAVIYMSLNTFILGVVTSNETVGLYAIVEKIYMAFRGMLNPFVQAIYPYLSKLFKSNQEEYYKKIKKISILYSTILLTFFLLLYIFGENILLIISKEAISQDMINILKIFSFTILFAFGTLFSAFLVIKDQTKKLFKITLYTLCLDIFLIIPAIYFYGVYGLAVSFLLLQIFHTILQFNANKEIFR